MFFKLALLLSVEMFVLVAAIFLLVYIIKSQVSKWFTYGAAIIIIKVLIMMICTVFGAVCIKHCSQNNQQRECHFGDNKCEKGMMSMRGHHGCSNEMMQEDKCEHSMKGCEMDNKDCKGKKGCEEMEGKSMCKEMIIINDDSLPKKQIIIKKK